MQLKAKDRARDCCPCGVLKVEESPRDPVPGVSIIYIISRVSSRVRMHITVMVMPRQNRHDGVAALQLSTLTAGRRQLTNDVIDDDNR